MQAEHALKSAMNTSAAHPTGDPNVVRETTRILTGDLMLYMVLALLVFAAWRFTTLGYFTAGDDVGYWLGVAGGVTMLFLFTYPLRKYVRFTFGWGKVKWWFWVH